MARPKKAVVDYFPHFVNHGKTMFTIESNWGNDGYAFCFKLYELLGSSEQHYLNCNDDETWEFLLAKTRLSGDTVTAILDKLSKLGSINAELWSNRIIRSDNFIENLFAVYKRRSVNVHNNEDILSYCMQKPPLSGITVNKNPHSIVEYSKVEEREVNETQLKDRYDKYTEHLKSQPVIERLCMNALINIAPKDAPLLMQEFIETCYGDILEKSNKFQVEQYFMNWVKKEGRVNQAINNQIKKGRK